MDSRAEVRATHRRNGFRWSAHFYLRRGLGPKDIEEEFILASPSSSTEL